MHSMVLVENIVSLLKKYFVPCICAIKIRHITRHIRQLVYLTRLSNWIWILGHDASIWYWIPPNKQESCRVWLANIAQGRCWSKIGWVRGTNWKGRLGWHTGEGRGGRWAKKNLGQREGIGNGPSRPEIYGFGTEMRKREVFNLFMVL